MTRDISLTERVPSVRCFIPGVSSHDYVIPNLKHSKIIIKLICILKVG